MQPKDRFSQIRDYIDSQNILDEIETFMNDDELSEFCDYLISEYDVDITEDDNFYEE